MCAKVGIQTSTRVRNVGAGVWTGVCLQKIAKKCAKVQMCEFPTSVNMQNVCDVRADVGPRVCFKKIEIHKYEYVKFRTTPMCKMCAICV